MPILDINGQKKNFNKIYYFAPYGTDSPNTSGTIDNPFKTPSGAVHLLSITSDKTICFFIQNGNYSDFNIWFNTIGKAINDGIDLTIIGEEGQNVIISCPNILYFGHSTGVNRSRITLSNLTIVWNNNEQDKGFLHYANNNPASVYLTLNNIYLKIGSNFINNKWNFVKGMNIDTIINFNNCILDKDISYIDGSFEYDNIFSYTKLNFNDSVIISNLDIDKISNIFSSLNNCLISNNIQVNFYSFPLYKELAHKGNNINPDEGISHLGVCGGLNAWYYNQYWYKFSEEYDIEYIPLEQIKQHYKLNYKNPKFSLENQIKYLDNSVSLSNNQFSLLTTNSVNTYNFIDLINSPKIISYIIDENMLGIYDSNDINKVEITLDFPFYKDYNHILVYKNGILQTINNQYEINDKKILFHILNIGDVVEVYCGWRNYNCKIKINYKIDEENNTTDMIDTITCEELELYSKYEYFNEKIATQLIYYGENIQIRDYVYNNNGELINVITRK